MKFYVTDNGRYHLTKDEAEKDAREIAKDSYQDVRVDQVDVETTRENVLRMLNVDGGHTTVTKANVYVTKGRKKND